MMNTSKQQLQHIIRGQKGTTGTRSKGYNRCPAASHQRDLRHEHFEAPRTALATHLETVMNNYMFVPRLPTLTTRSAQKIEQ